MTRTGRAVSGAAVLGTQMALRTVVGILLSPLLLEQEGRDVLGAYSIVMQIVGYLQLLELGMSAAIVRQWAQDSGKPADREAAERLATTSAAVLGAIGLAVGLGSAIAAATVPLWLEGGHGAVRSAALALGLYAVWMPFRFPLSLFQLGLYAGQRIALYGFGSLVGEVLRLGLAVGLILGGGGLVGVAAATIAGEAATAGLAWYWARRDIGRLRWARRPSPTVVWSLFRVGFPLGLMSLGDRLTFYSCDVVTGALFGATATAGFYGTRMPGFFAASVIWRLGDAVVPGVNQLYGAGETAAFRGAYDRVLGYGLGIAVWAGAAVCVFSGPLVGVWLGPELYIGSATACAAGLLVPLSTYKNLVTRFLIAEGRLGTYPAVVFAEGVASVVLGVACARTWGIAGMLWGMILAQGITLAFLVRRSGALFRAPALRVLLGVASWGLRASAVGVIACVAWVAARACGVVVPWPAGLAAVLALGALGFHRFGLTAADRTRVTAAARRLTARRTADEGRT